MGVNVDVIGSDGYWIFCANIFTYNVQYIRFLW